MKILIFEMGGQGCVIGGFLARMGHDVSLVIDAPSAAAIEKNGLKICGIWGDFYLKALSVYSSREALEKSGEEFDLVVWGGAGDAVKMLEKIPAEKWIIARDGFEVEDAPGVVKIVAVKGETVISALPDVKPARGLAEIAYLFSNAKIPARSSGS